MGFSILEQTRYHWRVLLIRGIIAVLFGLLVVAQPAWTILALVYLFGAYALIDGIMAVVGSLQERSTSSHWWELLIRGIVGIIVGLLVFFWPDKTVLGLFFLVGIWAIVTGVLELIAAFALPGGLGLEWPLVLGGVLLLILGIVFVRHPVASMTFLVWILGLFAIVYGVVQFARAFQQRSLAS